MRPSIRIVILGGGFGGAFAAKQFAKVIGRQDLEVILIDRVNYLLYYPLLIEAAVGTVEPRHVVTPIRAYLGNKIDFRVAEVQRISVTEKTVTVLGAGKEEPETVKFDQLVVALGSITRIPDNVPGLKQFGFQMKSLSDGIVLRDRGIQLLEAANQEPNADLRREMLSVVVVGANYTGVEFAGEYQAFLQQAMRAYPNLKRSDLNVYLLEYGDRILPTMKPQLAAYAEKDLTRRGIHVLKHNTVTEITETSASFQSGEIVSARTVVWTAGITSNPLLKDSGLPLTDRGAIDCESDLRVKGTDCIWAIGDCAHVLHPNGKPYAPTAQNSSRQGPLVAKNIAAFLEGRPTKPFVFNDLGSFAAFGNRRAVAEVLGVKLYGTLGWFFYRAAYLSKFPTFSMKMRLALDWLVELIFPYPPVQIGIHTNRTKVQDGANHPVPSDHGDAVSQNAHV